MSEREASCSCGQLRVIATGDPLRVSICHCLACQRRTGSSYGYQARFAREQLRISGESREYVRHADADGAVRRFNFCPDCGTTVHYTCDETPEVIAVAVGAFADPDFPPPQRSVWEEYDLHWVEEPLGAWDPEGYANLRAKTMTRIAYGEREWTLAGFGEPFRLLP